MSNDMTEDRFGHEFHTHECAYLSQILIHYFRNADAGSEMGEIANAVQGIDSLLHDMETRLAAMEGKAELAETVALWKIE